MSDEFLILKVISKSGTVNEIQVAELLEVDGKPYQPANERDQLLQLYNHLTGRVSAIEAILASGREH